jgi:hypothetical protein
MCNVTRRRVVQFLALGGAVIATPIGMLGNMLRVNAQTCSHGELYGGFLLLAQGASLPSCVQPPSKPAPSMCGAEEPGQPWTPPTAVTEAFATPAELAAVADYVVYQLGALPTGLELGGVDLVKQPTGEHYEATVRYQAFDPELGDWATVVTITTSVDTQRPYPLWTHSPEQEGDEDITLVKVGYTPELGIFVQSAGQTTGDCDLCPFKFMWTRDGVLYTMSDQYSHTFAGAVALVSAVVAVP